MDVSGQLPAPAVLPATKNRSVGLGRPQSRSGQFKKDRKVLSLQGVEDQISQVVAPRYPGCMMLRREIMPVCSENPAEHAAAFCGQKSEHVNV
jgi:hypothetical protein